MILTGSLSTGQIFNYYAINLTLSRSDGLPVVDGDSRTDILVSLICYNVHYRFPPP